jgi:microcystin-dependent protein
VGRGVPDTSLGWTPDPVAGYQPAPSVGAHSHSALTDISAAIPSGTIWMWYGLSSNVPTGWAICDGTNGTPNLKGRVPVGVDAADTDFDVLGEIGGAKTVALSIANLASHNHTQDSHNHTQNSHGHTQDSHGHTQDSHGHTQNAHNHGRGTIMTGSTPNNPGQYIASGTPPTVFYSNNGSGYTNDEAGTSWDAAITQSNTATNQGSTATNQGTTATNQGTTATNQTTGSGTAHSNLQPYCALHFIMKL